MAATSTTTSSTSISTTGEPVATAPVPLPPAPTTAPSSSPPSAAKVVVSERGVVLPVKATVKNGWQVETPCGRTALVRSAKPLSAAVVLDPGHGGRDRGARAPSGLAEAEVNLAVANHAREALERAGVSTVLTRTADYQMTLGNRARVARALEAQAFVSIHHNAEPDGPRAGPGTETYFQLGSAASKRLSGLIYEEVVRTLEPLDVAWVADTDAGAKYRRGKGGEDYYGILRRSNGTTGVLAELGFISNPPEAALFARPKVQKAEGEAVARGVLRFLNTADPGSGYVEPYPRDEPKGPTEQAGPTERGPACVDPPL